MKKVLSIFFTAVILLISGYMFMPEGISNSITHENVKTGSQESKKLVNKDFAEEYPLPNGEMKNHVARAVRKDIPHRLMNKIRREKTGINNKIVDDFKYRMQAVIMRNRYQKLLGMDMTTSLSTSDDDEIRTVTAFADEDAKVVYFDEASGSLGKVYGNIDQSGNISNLIDYAKYVESEGIDLLYFETPGKFASNPVYKDRSVEKKAELIDALVENGIDYIDSDEYMPKDKTEYAKMFYKTDHHWLPSTGIYADKVLCEYLNNNYNYNIDTSVFAPENYNIVVADNPFLGSWGRKVTEVYTDPEPFELYYPKYKPDLTVYNTKYDETVRGNIEETLFDKRYLTEGDIYSRNCYGFYGLGDTAYISVHNNDIHDGSRVLILKTSFADCMLPYLTTSFEDIDVIDPRRFKGSIKGFMKKNRPDIIIMVYGKPDNISAFDFR